MAVPSIPPTPPFNGATYEQQLRGVHDDGTNEGVIRTKLTQGELVRLGPPLNSQMTTSTAGTSSVGVTFTGNPTNLDGSNMGISMNAAAGFPNGCSLTMAVWGKVVGVRYRAISTTPNFTVVIDGISYPVKNIATIYNTNTYPSIAEFDSVVIVADDLPDGKHIVQLCLPSDATASKVLVFYGFVVEKRAGQESRLRLQDVTNTGTLTTSAVGIPKLISSGTYYYRGLRGVMYTNIHASSTAVVTVKYSTNIVWQVTLAPKASATFDLLSETSFDGNTSTFNHLCDTASAVNFMVLARN